MSTGAEQVGTGLWRMVVRTPMRDGVTLVGDLYGPDPHFRTARHVVLERTPYGRRKPRASDEDLPGEPVPEPAEIAAGFVTQGWLVLRQDTRGRGDSEGEFVKYEGEAEDGFDTLAWIVAQPWSSGRVGTVGVSYSAHAQLAAATQQPPGLVAMVLDSGGFASAYEVGGRAGGAFEMKQVTWALRNAKVSPEAQSDDGLRRELEAIDVPAAVADFPWTAEDSPLRRVPAYDQPLREQYEHETFSPFWSSASTYARPHYPQIRGVSTLAIGSWYDPYVVSTIEHFHELGRDGQSSLVMGPWTHGHRSTTHSGNAEFGEQAALARGVAPSYQQLRVDWLRAAFDGAPATRPRVTYFLMGGGSGARDAHGRLVQGGRWHTAGQWPPEHVTVTRWCLTGAGALDATRPGAGGVVRWTSDPAHPVPTLGGQVTSGEPVMRGGAYDQGPGRADVATFRSAPLTEALEVAGPVSATLKVRSSAPDLDLVIKLVDEHPSSEDWPDGYAMNLTEGIERVRLRGGHTNPPLEPDRWYEITVRAPDTANLFAVGHRVRLDVACSDFPRFDVNPQTGQQRVPGGPEAVAQVELAVGEPGCTLQLHQRRIVASTS